MRLYNVIDTSGVTVTSMYKMMFAARSSPCPTPNLQTSPPLCTAVEVLVVEAAQLTLTMTLPLPLPLLITLYR